MFKQLLIKIKNTETGEIKSVNTAEWLSYYQFCDYWRRNGYDNN